MLRFRIVSVPSQTYVTMNKYVLFGQNPGVDVLLECIIGKCVVEGKCELESSRPLPRL